VSTSRCTRLVSFTLQLLRSSPREVTAYTCHAFGTGTIEENLDPKFKVGIIDPSGELPTCFSAYHLVMGLTVPTLLSTFCLFFFPYLMNTHENESIPIANNRHENDPKQRPTPWLPNNPRPRRNYKKRGTI
jgi:hypothetical protein